MKSQSEKLNYMLEYLKEDSDQYKSLDVSDDYKEKRMAVRSLMNIRMPKEVSKEFLEIQDEFLREEATEKGVISVDEILSVKETYGSNHSYAEKIAIFQGDICSIRIGAIVNAANSGMLGCFVPCHRCIDNAIHSASGVQLRAECNHIMNQRRIQYGESYEEPTGTATLTKGYNLPADYVIHTVGPIVGNQLNDLLRENLKNCYENVMKCALDHNIRSIAFCCISTGEFHFPNREAAKIAVDTVTDYLDEHGTAFDKVVFNVFKDIDKECYEGVLRAYDNKYRMPNRYPGILQ